MRSSVKRKQLTYGDAPLCGTPERHAWLRLELERANEQFLACRTDVHWVIRGAPGHEQISIEWKRQPWLAGAGK